MKFRNRKLKAGDTRRKKVFLIIPKLLNDEWRWLCFTEIFQIYSFGGSETGYDYSPAGWKDIGWGDKILGIKYGKSKTSMFTLSSYTEFEIEYGDYNINNRISKRLDLI